MKNIIGILLLLLLLLIGSCVYQKTYTLYTLKHNDENTTTQPEKQLQSLHTTDVKKVQEKHAVTAKPLQAHTKQTTAQKEVTNETPMLEKIKTSVVTAFTSQEQSNTKGEPDIQAIPLKTVENTKHIAQNKPDTQLKEKEVVEYLLKVLEERDTTLTQRDEAESKLQALIKVVLQERQVAIEAMEEQVALSEKEHKQRLKNRDETAKAIYQKYTENKGK